jgi:hypothetical protein
MAARQNSLSPQVHAQIRYRTDKEPRAECPDTELCAEWCPAADGGNEAADRCAIAAAYDHPADTDPELDRELST